MNVVLLGSTGLVGDALLKQLVVNDAVKQITTFSRRPPKVESEKIVSVVDSDTSKWYKEENFKGQDVAISAFGTTRAAAGGNDKFREIEIGNNVKFAEVAKSSGVPKFILVSSGGASSSSLFPYTKVKGEIEDAVKGLKFDSAFILRPGLLLGEREESRFVEHSIQKLSGLPVFSKIIPANKAETVAKKIVELLSATGSKSLECAEINKV